jgi:ADP-ribosyl-[dinitrogen reductase] hydrolase
MYRNLPTPRLIDRFVGALLGTGVGDALGAPVEEWSSQTIRATLGQVRDYQTTFLGRGIITDDTQMTMLLAESVIQNEHFDPAQFAYSLGQWMKRNDEGIEPARGVGYTISLSCRRLYKGTYWKRSGEFSASNGAATRVAPLGLLYAAKGAEGLADLLTDVKDSAVPTHIDPVAIAGAQVIAVSVMRLASEDRSDFNADGFINWLIGLMDEYNPQMAEVLRNVKYCLLQGAGQDVSFLIPMKHVGLQDIRLGYELDTDLEHMARLGNGRIVLESVPAALYAFLSSPSNFERSLLVAINAGGDTDSIGAITGALSGAFNGAQAIPMRWVQDLEKKDYLIELANLLYDLASEGKPRKIPKWPVVG